jgi:hypothetical protein
VTAVWDGSRGRASREASRMPQDCGGSSSIGRIGGRNWSNAPRRWMMGGDGANVFGFLG